MSKNLVIVESPGKTKTIEKALGKDYHVMSSQGHVRDIEGVGKNSIGIDFNNHYQPNYVIDPQKHKLLEQLQKEVDAAQTIWLASDEDREGEAIAWHLKQVLNLKGKETHRIVFHEITPSAIQNAIENPRDIDYNLVNAQQARRVLDRIVGFELSPVLWKKVTTGLSAGRVQSVVVRLIVEREREIEEFQETAQYRVCAEFIGKDTEGKDASIKCELNHRFADKEQAMAFLEQCKNASFNIDSIQHKPAHRSPAPPFTTSLLQQEAGRKLKFTVSKTMRLAQSLYEAGKITYMRTDSLNLSNLAISTAKTEIINAYGEKYHKTRQYHTSSKGAQEAHEAIRPTYMNVHEAGANTDEKRLYDLIWKRTIACQMADAEIMNTRVEVSIDGTKYLFVATGETVIFDGFTRVYIQSNDDEGNETVSSIPQLDKQVPLSIRQITAQQTFTKAPYRYTDVSMVKKMEELGIGRPSTYATIIETIQSRKYVEKGTVAGHKRDYNVLSLKNGKITDTTKTETVGQDSQKLIPTDLGRVTNDFLVEHFPEILNYNFTAREEENFDRIANGEADWIKTVDEFYKQFHPYIEKVPAGKCFSRLLGTFPKTNEPVLAKISKIGPCIQIGDSETDKPRFVSIPKNYSIFTITLEQAFDLYIASLPSVVCRLDGKEVIYGEGKYGPYLKYDKTYISLPADIDHTKLTTRDVRELVEKQKKQSEPLRVYGDIMVMNGRYGIYIKTPQGNVRVPKAMQSEDLSEEQCRELIAAQESGGSTAYKYKRDKSKKTSK